MTYAKNIILALNQLMNALLGRDHDMTMSTRAYLRERQGGSNWQRKFIDKLFFWETEHCKNAFQWEYRKSQKFIKDHKVYYPQ